MKRRAILALFALLGFAPSVAAQECSPQNWKACKGKPWVIGNSMETPIGDKWWPNKTWGERETKRGRPTGTPSPTS